MASELTVQTLRGPTSGADANKIIIPPGHTLDASSGLEMPAGSLVQIKTVTTGHNVNWSTAAWNDVWRPVFTPKYSDSLLTFSININVLNEASNTTDLWVGWRGLGGQYNYGFGKSGNLSGWNQNNNSITYSVTANTVEENSLWIQLRAASGVVSYFNYNSGNGNARSSVTMWETRQ